MSTTFAPDHALVGRYRIIDLIGVGHTAEVYRAEDLSLHRTVVVKVLLAKWAAHEDVRRDFRDAIIRAATLGHPHVARVYDGGQESGSIFVVTEYLSGGSLEDLLASGRHLSIEDTARLGRDVASALAYLHANGVVHGGLSPKKLLFDDEGRVRVSDIALAGLAGAYRGAPTLDQARYLAPEQVAGEPARDTSDVYALALVLFEAATGTSPFESMSAEAMARGRASTPLPVRAELGTLDMLLAQATIPDPLLRIDAEQFATRLNAVADASPLTVDAPTHTPLLAQFAPPQPRSSIGFRPPSPGEIVGDAEAPRRLRPSVDVVRSPDRSLAFAAPVPSRGRRTFFLVAAVILLLAALGGAAVWKLGLLNTTHTVPSLVNVDYRQAANLLKGDGFTLSVTAHKHSANVPANQIISQSPSAGSSAKAGLVVTVTVSDGPVMVTMPSNLIGEDCTTATSQLAALHVTALCPSSAAVASATVPAGKVVRVTYHAAANPASVPVNSTVTLVLSSGPPAGASTTTTAPSATTTTTPTTTTTSAAQGPRPVPNVVGMNRAQVDAAFRKAQLFYTTRGPNAGTTKWTKVVSEIPAAGTMVKWRSTITLNVQ
ncbi:MAG TPA: protein kinase [Acidimicrobiales bacterium]|nr:protein kinase [Acidimicrobiales bacterium]